MHAQALRSLAAAAAVISALPAAAEDPLPCELPAREVNPLADRAGILARYERLPLACLHEIFSACADSAGLTLLDFSEAAACSFGYEALLSQGFGGNFHALMAWWYGQRGKPQP